MIFDLITSQHYDVAMVWSREDQTVSLFLRKQPSVFVRMRERETREEVEGEVHMGRWLTDEDEDELLKLDELLDELEEDDDDESLLLDEEEEEELLLDDDDCSNETLLSDVDIKRDREKSEKREREILDIFIKLSLRQAQRRPPLLMN